MKILQVINNMEAGGAQKLLLEALPLYLEQGIAMDLLLLDGTPHPFVQALKATTTVRVFSLGNGSVYHPLHLFRIIPYLRQYQLVHVHLFPALYWVVLAKWLSFAGTPLVFTEHNTTNRRMESRLFRYFDRVIYRGYCKLVCITGEVARILQAHTGRPANRFTVIENGVNLAPLTQAAPYPRQQLHPSFTASSVVLIQVAEFRAQKDQATLIRAMKLLPDHYKLLLVGEGVLKGECEQLAATLGLLERVCFTGMRMDIPALLQTADLVVLSSHYEGLSLSAIEGMASGKPFLAADVPGLSDLVSGAGLLFRRGDAADLALKVGQLMQDPELYQTVAAACREKAGHYDLKRMVAAHIELYQQVAGQIIATGQLPQ